MSKKKVFIGRDKEINDIYQNIEIYRYGKVRNMIYFGLSKMGKTMLLRQVEKNLQHDETIVPIYIDFDKIATIPEDFGKRFISETVSAINKHNTKSSTSDQNSLRQYPLHIDGLMQDQYVAPLFEGYSGKSRLEKLAVLFSVPAGLLYSHKKKPLFLIDNITAGMQLGSFRGMKDIGKTLAEDLLGSGTSSVISANYDSHMMRVLDGEIFPVKNVEFYEIRPLGILEVQKALKDHLEEVDIDLIERIAELTTGHPYYFKLLLRFFKNKKQLSRNDIDRYFERSLQGEAALSEFMMRFYTETLAVSRYHGPLKYLLKFLASREGLSQTDISKMTDITQGALRNYLNELERLRILFRDGGKYFFVDEVFQKWILLNR